MTNDETQKVRNALGVFEPFERKHTNLIEALDILDAELAKPEPEPVVYWNGDRSVIPADEVSYIPNWTDYYPTPLYRHPPPQSQPVARATGYYGGNCVIEPLDGKSVFPVGMAVYSAPVAAQEVQPVAEVVEHLRGEHIGRVMIRSSKYLLLGTKLYTAPPSPQSAQEPVACKHNRYSVDVHEQTGTCYDCGAEGRMRFVVDGTAPPSREWAELADDEVIEIADRCTDVFGLADLISDALRAKNSGE